MAWMQAADGWDSSRGVPRGRWDPAAGQHIDLTAAPTTPLRPARARSGTDLETPGGGCMRGSFQMAVLDPAAPQARGAREGHRQQHSTNTAVG